MKNADCELLENVCINSEIFRLDFAWDGLLPKAGQFFMIKPKRSSVFLGRPISVAAWYPEKPGGHSGSLSFLIEKIGKGTKELADLCPGEKSELTGPLGNAWVDFLPQNLSGIKPVALIGGSLGLAPLCALLQKNTDVACNFHLYAGFRTALKTEKERAAILGAGNTEKANLIVATEDGTWGNRGHITDFLEPEKYSAVCTCGPQAMMKTVAQKCAAVGVPCFVSMDQRMACGVGACLGCTVKTLSGNRRCCADGPIFDAREIIFDE